MKKLLSWAALSTLAISAAACSGGGTAGSVPAIPTADPAKAVSKVAFTITIPPASSITTNSKARAPRPMFTAAPNTSSASFAVTSVSGNPYNGTPTVVNFNGTTCTGTTTLTCNVTIAVPAGNDVILVKTFSQADAPQNAQNGEANLQVSAAGGQTVNEPTTLGGTVAKIGVAAFVEEGVAGTYPVVVTAYDSNGAAIIGTYSTAITLADSDTANSTLSATSVPDSTTAASLTIKYNGAAMTPATISATATGIAAANITNATFPDATYPTMNNATANIEVDQSYSESYDAQPSPTPDTNSNTMTNTTLTGQSLSVNGSTATNLVSQSTTGMVGYLPGTSTNELPLYYAWTANGSALSYGYVGYNYATSQSTYTYSDSELCAAPYSKLVVLPIPTGPWDAFANTGDCTYTWSFNETGYNGQDTVVFKSDGSYEDKGTYSYNNTNNITDWVLKSDGTAVLTNNQTTGSSILTLPVPSPGADVATAMIQTFPGAIPAPGTTATPAPVSTTAPNPWKIAGIPAGAPLLSDKFTPKGSVTALPTGCAVDSSLLGATPALTQVDEQLTIVDPSYDYYDNYMSVKYNHYYLNGVGEVCTVENYHSWYPDSDMMSWFNGSDQDYYTDDGTQYSYLTGTGLVNAFARTRSMTQAMPAAAQALTSANLAMRERQLGLHHLQQNLARARGMTLRAVRHSMRHF